MKCRFHGGSRLCIIAIHSEVIETELIPQLCPTTRLCVISNNDSNSRLEITTRISQFSKGFLYAIFFQQLEQSTTLRLCFLSGVDINNPKQLQRGFVRQGE